MDVMTDDRIEIFCLPDSSICRLCGENPLAADKCPITDENVCKPAYCIHYNKDKMKI